MATDDTRSNWAAAGGGFRASLLLRIGTIVMAAGTLANLGTNLLAGPENPSTGLTIVAWLLFILGLWLLAAGFSWLGAGPVFSFFGFVVGATFAIQGIQLLILLFTFTRIPFPPAILTLVRLIILLVFVWLERDWLSRGTRNLLVGAVALQLLKVLLRTLGYLPELGVPIAPLLDTVLLLILAAAVFQLGGDVSHAEDDWATTVYDMGHSDLAEFNNPEHEWNKQQVRERN